MRRVILSVGSVVVTAAAVGIAQPPAPPAVPLPPPMVPPPADPAPRTVPLPTAGGQPPAGPAPVVIPTRTPGAAAETPLSRFEPFAALPVPTQLAVRSVLLGANWMAKRSLSQGRFEYGYYPSLRQPMEGDHNIRQAQAALALAQAARFTGDDKQAALAGQAVLALLADTHPDAADPNCRVPVQASMHCNRVGFAAILALAIYELPFTDDKLTTEADRLCEFLRRQARPDGSIHYTDGPTDVPTAVDPGGLNEYPGFALQALAVSNRLRPAPWKAEAVRKGITFYHGWFKAHPHPMLAATLVPAAGEFFTQTRTPEVAGVVFELNDWLIALQYKPDPRHASWAGGFRGWANGLPAETTPGFETGTYLQAIAWAFQVNRQVPDLGRDARYRQAAADAVQFLTGLQYMVANTQHFTEGFRYQVLIGGFYLSPTDGNLRIDATATAVTGLLRYLNCGAER